MRWKPARPRSRSSLARTETDFAVKTDSLRSAEQALADKQAELARLTHELSDRSLLADSRQIELVAVHAQIDALKNRVDDAEKEFAATQHRLELQRGESDTATRELTEARGRVENLSQRVTDLDGQPMIQVREAELLGGRVAELEAQLATQSKALADREFENSQLRQANEAAEQIAQDLRVELAALNGGGKSPVADRLRAEKADLEQQLRFAQEARSKLQREFNAVQQQAESAWATERVENALLRERINDIAAEVAKLAMTLEGPNSPIEAILAAEPAKAQRNGNGANAGGTLADRIRALQSHASRAPQPG